jgi:hypothetical protein
MATTIVPFRSPSSYPNRRALLGQLITGAALAAPAVAIASDSPDPHLAWFAEWRDAIDFMNGPVCHEVEELSDLPIWHRANELEDLIGATPARTLAGTLCQLRMMRQWCTAESLPNEACDAALVNALATLDRLARGQAHG